MGDTFRWKSENVSATEVENQIMAMGKNVFPQVVVVGIKVPNHEGRAGFAVVELEKNYQNKSEEEYIQLLNKLLDHLKNELPKYALPIFVKFVDEIRRTDNHKVPKKLYRNQVLPHGENRDEKIYWLKGYKKYQLLTDNDWSAIVSGTAKL